MVQLAHHSQCTQVRQSLTEEGKRLNPAELMPMSLLLAQWLLVGA